MQIKYTPDSRLIFSGVKKMANVQQLLNELRREVAAANKAIDRLRSYAERTGDTSILNYAYAGAQADIKRLGGRAAASGHFTTEVKRTKSGAVNVSDLQKKLNAARRFREKPTSSIRRTGAIYNKRAETFSKKAKANISSDDLKKMFESGLWDQLKNQYGSKTAQKMIGKIQQQRDELKRQLEQGERITFRGEYGRRLNTVFREDSDILERYLNVEN